MTDHAIRHLSHPCGCEFAGSLPHRRRSGCCAVAGEPSFSLSKPRFDASRRTVSPKAKPLHNTSSSSTVARATALPAPRRFGAASLSMLPHPSLTSGGGGGHDCEVQIDNPGGVHVEILSRQFAAVTSVRHRALAG